MSYTSWNDMKAVEVSGVQQESVKAGIKSVRLDKKLQSTKNYASLMTLA